jgi:uncharacterized protein with NRDE domain
MASMFHELKPVRLPPGLPQTGWLSCRYTNSMAVCTKLTNAIYVVSFAITGTSMQKVKRRKKEKEKENISRENDNANIDSFNSCR